MQRGRRWAWLCLARRAVPDTNVVIHDVKVAVPMLPEGLAGVRIAHVSDLHAGRWTPVLQAARDRLTEAPFDFVFATGDFSKSPRRWRQGAEIIKRFFGPIAANTPVFGVLGNHDHPDLGAEPDLPITFLRNESLVCTHNDVDFELAGVEQTVPRGGDVQAALTGPRRAALTILLAHYPSTVFDLVPLRVDLQLSGHTHGGQIRLPGLGCIWTNDKISRRMAMGLHVVAGTFLHVSAGIGASPPIPIRVNCPPEITVLTLKPAAVPANEPEEAIEAMAARGGSAALSN